MRGPDIYSKTPSPINHSLSYFPMVPESAYMNHPRLAALQHQLHISTNNSSTLDGSRSHNWSNLVIPYHQHPNYKTSDNINRNREVPTTAENDSTGSKETKKKNPYSIEELLKKPAKKLRPISLHCTGFQQPYGGLIVREMEGEVSCHSGSSDSEQEKDIKIDVE